MLPGEICVLQSPAVAWDRLQRGPGLGLSPSGPNSGSPHLCGEAPWGIIVDWRPVCF